ANVCNSARLERCGRQKGNMVVFSDESRFCFSDDIRQVQMWRRHGDMSFPAAVVECPTTWMRLRMIPDQLYFDGQN
ncbi:hypothetical protein NPIL_189541, partial [Nephila pilipes]